MNGELVDRRYLGAIRPVDANTGLPVTRPLRIVADGVEWFRTRAGNYVIASVDDPDLETHVDAFESPPAFPPIGDRVINLSVEDETGRYLPRRAAIALPRDPNPVNAGASDSLFRLHDVSLFRAPKAPVEHGWAVVRATVRDGGTGDGVPNALLRIVTQRIVTPPIVTPPIVTPPVVVSAGGDLLASGLTDARGEGLVGVPGVPVTTWDAGNGGTPAGGPVLIDEIGVDIEVIVDPTAASPPDPDDLESRRTTLLATVAESVSLASGREVTVEISI